MKNKLIGILAIVLMFGLLCACPTDGNNTTKFTVTFDANGGTVSPDSIEIENGKTIAALPTPIKGSTGKYFWGWFVDKDTWQNKFTESTAITKNITVYARWENAMYLPLDNIWTYTDNGVTISYTVSHPDEDGDIINVTVSGVSDVPEEREDWYGEIAIPYTIEAGKRYKYDINCWIASGSYNFGRVKYRQNGDTEVFIPETPFTVTSNTSGTWIRFTDNTNFSSSVEQNLVFFCGLQNGSFSLRPYISEIVE